MDELIVDLSDVFNNNGNLPSSYLLKYYQDLNNRTFWINDEVNEGLLYELTHYILKWNKEDKDIEESERKPIYLMFDCPGGNLDSQGSICDIIELSKTPIIGVAICLVGSAAAYIYLSCHVRLAFKDAYFILHKGSAALSGDFDNIMTSIDDYKRVVNKLIDFIVLHSKYTKEEVEDRISKDWYVRMEEAEEKGLVDQIITDINILL